MPLSYRQQILCCYITHWPNPPRHIWLFDVMPMHHSDDYQINHDVASRIIPLYSGRTSYGTPLTIQSRFKECCSLWSSCWSDAMALVGNATLMMMMKITIRCCGRFLWKVRFIGRPDDVATIRVRWHKLPSITTECYTLQSLQQVHSSTTIHIYTENKGWCHSMQLKLCT